MKDNVYRNGNGYWDPTAGSAVAHYIHDEKKGRKKMAKRSCRRTAEEDIQHEFAVKVRKMTDSQICEMVEEREQKAIQKGFSNGYSDGVEAGKKIGMDAGKQIGFEEGQRSEDMYEIEHFIELIETLPGIGHATMMKIRGLARKEGLIGIQE